MKALHVISWILVIVGGLNWLLVGIGNWDVVALIFGAGSVVSKIIYILVGLGTLVILFTHKKSCKECTSSDTSGAPAM